MVYACFCNLFIAVKNQILNSFLYHEYYLFVFYHTFVFVDPIL